MQRMYQNILKEGNGDHKYLRCPDIWDNNFEVLRPSITSDKIDLDCAENVKSKPTVNDSVFVNYSNTTNFLVNG